MSIYQLLRRLYAGSVLRRRRLALGLGVDDPRGVWLYSGVRIEETAVASLGEILRRARLARGVTLERAEQVTRISRRYLEALEREEFSLLPAPVYARGFLRTYATFLGLEASQLLPLFPVSYLDQPVMEPLPRLDRPPIWSPTWLVSVGVVGLLVLIIVLLYTFGRGEGSPFGPGAISGQESAATATVAGSGSSVTAVSQGGVLPDLRGRNAVQAVELLQRMSLGYFVWETFTDQAPAGVVLEQSPAPGSELSAGQLVTIIVSRGQR